MVIDARRLELQELFKQLKEILASGRSNDVFIEILVDTGSDVKKVKSFVAMTGCQTDVKGSEGSYIINVTGMPCCV